MDVTPTAADSAINHDDPGRANLAQKDPSYNATTHGCATHSSNACRSGTPTEKTPTCPTHATDTGRVEASLSSPWCQTRRETQRLPPTSPRRGPRFPDPRNPPATEKGAAPHPDPSFHLTLLSREPDPQGAGQTRGTHGLADDHENVIEQSSRVFPSKARIKGYVHRGDRRTPPPGKSNAWDAGGVSAHITCANGTRDTLPAER